MGRLFAALRAEPESRPAANPAKVANPPRLAGVGFADSQDSQSATIRAPDRFADSQDSQSATIRAPDRFADSQDSQRLQPEASLEHFAIANGIVWRAAHSQMIDGDAQAGAAQLEADTGDGIEHAGVACWLRLLADRAPKSPSPGRSPESMPQRVACEACQHFQPDPINPPAGAGLCRVNAGADSIGPSLHPMALRWCGRFQKTGALTG